MNKIRIAIIVAALLGLLITTAVSAAGTFFCTDLVASGGNGSFRNPWACSTEQQFNQVVQVICNQYNGGNLYRIFIDRYIFYRIQWIFQNDQRVCTIVYQSEYPGYPPNTGPGIPYPLVLGSAMLGGAVLIVAGLALRKKSAAL